MTTRRSVVVGVGAWCAVVALVSTFVWVVIARAGQGVVPESQPRAAMTRSLPVPHEHRDAGRRPGRRTHHPITSHQSPAVAAASPTNAPPSPVAPRTAGAATPAGPSATAHSSPPTRPSSSTVASPPPPTPQRRSWTGAAGHVVAECQATKSHLVSAYPGTGWRYQILSRGPGTVRVTFQRIGEDPVVKVTARCVSGVPRFSVSNGEPGDDPSDR
jgi:hypothetical protein